MLNLWTLPKRFPRAYKIIIFISLFLYAYILASYFCYPFNNGSLHLGADTGFHINRIVSLYQAIENNDVYPYLFVNQNYGFGYPTPLYYCNIFLYHAANALKNNQYIILVYKQFIFSLVYLAILSSGICTYFICKDKSISYLTMTLYILNTHSITDILRRSGLGELLALIFIPICLLGIYETLYHKYNYWIILAIGYCGLLLSHNISFILMCIVFIIFIIIRFKYLLNNKSRIIAIIIAVISALLCSLFFLLPMLEGLSNNDMVINHTFNNADTLYDSCSSILDLLNFDTSTNIYLNNTVGPFLLLYPLSSLLIKNKRKNNPFIFTCLCIGYITLLTQTKLFPWKLLPFLSFIQFVQRLLPISIAMLSLSGGYYCSLVLKRLKNIPIETALKLSLILIIIIPTFFMLQVNYKQIYGYYDDTSINDIQLDQFSTTSDTNTYNAQQISSGDYLNYPGDIDYKNYKTWTKWDVSPIQSYINVSSNSVVTSDDNVDDTKYNHYLLTIDSSTSDQWVIIPKSYYYDYIIDVYDSDNNKVDSIAASKADDTGLIKFTPLESDTKLIYDIYYQPTNIQLTSMTISKISYKIVIVIFALQQILITYINYKDGKYGRH